MHPTRKCPGLSRRKLVVHVAAALAAFATLAAEAAQIRGRVVNAETGKPAAGATVTVPGTNARAVTDADGQFTIGNVPAGPRTLVISGPGIREQRSEAVAADSPTPTELRVRTLETERIVVTGIREAEIAAVAAKREADTQVEVVTADEVGKLVDKNVADAVSRLPGVSTSTDKG